MMMEHVASWFIATFLHGVVLGAVAFALVPRVTSPALRCWLWRAVIFAPLVTATGSVVIYGRGFAAQPSVAAMVRPHVPASWRPVRIDIDERVERGGEVERTVVVRDPIARTVSLAITLLAGLGALAGITRWLMRHRVAMRRLAGRERVSIDSGSVRAAGVVVTCAPTIDVPVALSRREICVPAGDFFELPRSQRESVLLHELAHVTRGDVAWLDAANVMTATTWWAPFNGRLLRALRRDTELAADDHAIARGAEPAALVAALAAFAARIERGDARSLATISGVPLAARDSDLVARARRILGPPVAPSGLRTHVAVAVAGLVCVGAVVVAPVPRMSVPRSSTSLVETGARVVEIVEDDVRAVAAEPR